MQRSTADVEHELLQLWSSVEKDRDATTALRQQHAERQRRRQERRAAKLAPLSSSPLGLGGDGGGGDKGGWRRLGAADEEGGDGEAPEAVSGAGEAAAVEAGAAGVHRRMQQAAQAQGEGSTAAGGAQDEQHSLLRSASGGAAGASSSGPQPASPLKVPPHLPRIRTSSSQNLAQLGQQQPAVQALEVQAGAGVQRSGSGALRAPLQAVSSDSGGAYQAGEWGTRTRSGSQQLERLASSRQQQRGEDEDEDEERPGAGGERPEGSAGAALDGPSPREPSFWATFREMVADIYLVATGPEGNALQVGGCGGGGRGA